MGEVGAPPGGEWPPLLPLPLRGGGEGSVGGLESESSEDPFEVEYDSACSEYLRLLKEGPKKLLPFPLLPLLLASIGGP